MIDPLACVGRPPEHRGHRFTPCEVACPRGDTWNIHHVVLHGWWWPDIDPLAVVEAFATVDSGLERATYVGPECFLMKHSHVGHDALLWGHVDLAPNAVVGGHCEIGTNVRIGIGAVIRPRVHVGTGARIGAGAVVVCDVPAGETWVGNPARKLVKRSVSVPDAWKGSEAEYAAWEDFWARSHPSNLRGEAPEGEDP